MATRSRKVLASRVRHECFEALARGLGAGIPPAECLRLAREGHSGPAAACLKKAETQIASGRSLAFSLRDHGLAASFDIDLIELGEKNGQLDLIVSRLAQRYRLTTERLARLKAKLLMPLFVFAVALLVGPLPDLARGVIGPAGYVARLGFPILILLLGGLSVRYLVLQLTDNHHGALGTTLGRLPIVGTLLTNYSRAEFLERLSTFEQSGFPLIEAVEKTEQSLPGYLRFSDYPNIGTDLRYGLGLANSMKRHAVLDDATFALLSAGEQGGRLSETLIRISSNAREVFDQQLEHLLTWLPRLVYALVVGYVVTNVL